MIFLCYVARLRHRLQNCNDFLSFCYLFFNLSISHNVLVISFSYIPHRLDLGLLLPAHPRKADNKKLFCHLYQLYILILKFYFLYWTFMLVSWYRWHALIAVMLTNIFFSNCHNLLIGTMPYVFMRATNESSL